MSERESRLPAAGTSQGEEGASPAGRILLVLLILLTICAGCNAVREDRDSRVLPAPRKIENLIVEHLSKLYEQPKGSIWEDGKIYFLPEDPGIELLKDIQPRTGSLKVYRANVWSSHWAPEKFPVFVWAIGNHGEPRLGVLEGPDEIASRLPTAAKGLLFEHPEAREGLALVVGEMMAVFYGEKLSGRLQLVADGNCKWAEQSEKRTSAPRRVAGSCFSKDGVLERIIIEQKGVN